MFVLLMRVRLRSAWNTAQEAMRSRPLLSSFLVVISVLLFVGIFLGFRVAFEISASLGILNQTINQTLFYLFLFLFAGAVPFVSSTLLQSADYALLFASPISPKDVVAAKLVDATVTNSLQFSVLGIPALMACGAVCHIPLAGWLFLPIIIMLFALLPALITAFALLLLLAIVGMRRLRSAVTLLNAFTGTVVCIAVLSRIGAGRTSALSMHAVLEEHLKTLANPSGFAQVSPTGWFTDIFLVMSHRHIAFVPLSRDIACISFSVSVLFACCLQLGRRLLSAAAIAEEIPVVRIGTGRRQTVDAGNGRVRVRESSPISAILRKDVLILVRDTILVSQTAMPLILYLVPFILAGSDRSLQDLISPLALMMIGVILFMQTSILSLSSIGIESRAFWMEKTAPVAIRSALWAKLLWSSSISGGISVVLVMFTAVVFQLHVGVAIGASLLFMTCAVGLCGLGVGISAAFPKFVYDNPALRVSAWALIFGFIASTGYSLITGATVMVTYWLALRTTAVNLSAAFVLGALIVIVMTAACVAIPVIAGSSRLENYQWEH